MNLSSLRARVRFALHSTYALLVLLLCAYVAGRPVSAAAGAQAATSLPVLLDRTQATAIMPATVFYRGQSATIQGRNSAGIRFAGERLLLTALVDTSGYSTAIAQTYQAYLLSEVPLKFGDKTLAAGAYGYGFLEGDRVVMMDIGGTRLFETTTTRDPAMKRPVPLQMVPAEGDAFRLYLGRSFVQVQAAR